MARDMRVIPASTSLALSTTTGGTVTTTTTTVEMTTDAAAATAHGAARGGVTASSIASRASRGTPRVTAVVKRGGTAVGMVVAVVALLNRAWVRAMLRCSKALAPQVATQLACWSWCLCMPLPWLWLDEAEARRASPRRVRHDAAPRKRLRRLPPHLCRPQLCFHHLRAPGEVMSAPHRSHKLALPRRCACSARQPGSKHRCSHLRGHQVSRPPQRLL